MTNKIIDKQCFVDCEGLAENTANFSFNTEVLKVGKVKPSPQQMKRISFLLAHDLKAFAETNGDFSNLSANVLYSHLQSNQLNKNGRSFKNFFFFC